MKVIRLSKSSIGSEEKSAVLEVLDKEFLGMGQEVELFESEIASYIGVESDSVVCVNTGTSALHLAISALDIGSGDEVIVPSITYVASLQAISATGATAVICDVAEKNYLLDVVDAEKRITSNTKAIMAVHYASNSENLSAVYLLAKKFGLRVIEDAAQAFGCDFDGKKVGATGDITCFSFDGIKNITSGEGGAICSSDKEFIKRVKDARLLGVENDTENRFLGERSWEFDVKYQGYRYHMSNIMAAIGRVQLKRIDEFSIRRRELMSRYLARFSGFDSIQDLGIDLEVITPHIYVIKVKAGKRDKLMAYLREQGIQCGIHYQPNHYLSYYRTDEFLPIAEQAGRVMLTLPLHVDLENSDVDYVCDCVMSYLSDK